MGRFDIVVWNFERLESFFANFDKVRNYDPSRDRITIVSSSPSLSETQLIRRFEDHHQLAVRYLTRSNRGMDQLARAEYFTGTVGSMDKNLSHAYIFQMQDHYLDTTSEVSNWGPAHDFEIKPDVIPDGALFDLDRMENLAVRYDLQGFFCDRRDPPFFSLAGRNYIAPTGANFVIRSEAVRDESVQQACRQLIRSCEHRYIWCQYAEFSWGFLFFQEGQRFYDLKRERLFEAWDETDFGFDPTGNDFPRLMKYYSHAPQVRHMIRAFRDPRWALSAALRRAPWEKASSSAPARISRPWWRFGRSAAD
jgi:hypothetical protein